MINPMRKRFVKDYSLPIQLVSDPYFDYFLDLYEPFVASRSKYAVFLAALHELGEDGLDRAFDKAKGRITDAVTTRPAYRRLQSPDALLGPYPCIEVRSDSVYHEQNVGRFILSVDLVKANFQSFRHFDPDLVRGAESYEAFISSFDEIHPYVANSKKLRQIIFGNLQPKRQQAIQKTIMKTLMLDAVADGLPADWLRHVSSDEFIVVCENPDDIETAHRIMTGVVDARPWHVRLETLKLVQPLPDCPFWAKTTLGGELIEFKCVPAHFMAQVVKAWTGRPLHPYDLAFLFDGEHLAQFQKPVSQHIEYLAAAA